VIRRIQGIIESTGSDWAIVGLNGISLQIFLPSSILENLGSIGDRIGLFTHLSVREDQFTLYGFDSEDSLRLFELLLGVSGIGPRTALALLSTLRPEALVEAITSGDTDSLGKTPAVGKRTAARIVLELKDKLGWEWNTITTASIQGDTNGEVIGGLMALGYSAIEARRAVAALPQNQSLTTEERLRLALQSLGQG